MLNLKAEPTTKAGMACVVVSIPLKVDKFIINRLKTGEVCPPNGEYVDNAVVAYCCFKRIQNELMGNATSMSSYKVSAVTCGCTTEDFNISAICDKTVSAMRKVAGGIIKSLRFSVLTADYKAMCKTLDIKPDMDAFAASVYESIFACKKSIDVCFTGKFKAKKDQLDSALDVLENKVPDFVDKGKGQRRRFTGDKECYMSLKSGSPLDAIILHGFVEMYANNSFVCGSHVYVPIQYTSLVERSITDTGKIERYSNKLDRLEDHIAGVLSFKGATLGYLACKNISNKKKYSFADIKKAIK